MSYLLAIDEGTTGVRAHVFDDTSALRGAAYEELSPSYPQPGWVELDPEDIWRRTRKVCGEALVAAKTNVKNLRAIGICNQRATTLVWDRSTGIPVCP
ncbi:MAG TPA: FGGY family carbohydrate kinase, partial [Candidatus Acidoferrales bacterium]|nr:FGGY family carbohydrate kinase [Candidatus Acidoferrales bacterium]